MARSAFHPLDPLANHYVELPRANGKERAKCRHCESVFTAVDLYAVRKIAKVHLTTQHVTIKWNEYMMTQEDYDLDADFELLGKPNANLLQYRKYVCFSFDSNAKRASFIYCVLSKELLNSPEVKKKNPTNTKPTSDVFLDENDAMSRNDFTSQTLPQNYESGHLIGLGLARFSKLIYDVINTYSDVAIQHRQLNHGHWHYLEELVEGLLLHYKVRLMVGTTGHLDLPCSSRAQVPRWWWMIIVTSDEDNNNWRYSAYLFPNTACEENLTTYQVTIVQLIALVGFNIFPNVIRQLQTTHRSDIPPEDFEEWAMNMYFPIIPTTGENDESADEEPGPSKRKKHRL